MLLANAKIQKRGQVGKITKINLLKNKGSLQQDTTAKEIFQQIKLTKSHEINDCGNNEIKLNIFGPTQGDKLEIQTKKFTCPQWLGISNLKSSCRDGTKLLETENPQFELKVSQNRPYENSEILGNIQKTLQLSDTKQSSDYKKTNDIENEDKQNQFKIMLTNEKGNYEDIQYKSLYNLNKNSTDSDKNSLESMQLSKNCSTLTYKGKILQSKSIKSLKMLQKNHQEQFQRLSQYGLKPSEQNRLKKIQTLQKRSITDSMQQKSGFEFHDFDQTQYFCSGPKLMSKQRKSSAIVQFTPKQLKNKDFKKSKSRPKHSLSKGKSNLAGKSRNK